MARDNRSKTSTNKVSALPQRWLPGAYLEPSRPVVEVSAFRSGTCLHTALFRLIIWKLLQRGSQFGGRWPPVQELHQQSVCFATKVAAWCLLVAQLISGGGLIVSELDLSTCSFGTLVNLEIIATVEPVWRPVATGPRIPPTRCLLCHRRGCLEPTFSAVDQWWSSQSFGAGPVHMQL